MAESAKATNGEVSPDDVLTVESVLARFGGDAKAALASAIEDVVYLDRELRLACLAMSSGFARGWAPGKAKHGDVDRD